MVTAEPLWKLAGPGTDLDRGRHRPAVVLHHSSALRARRGLAGKGRGRGQAVLADVVERRALFARVSGVPAELGREQLSGPDRCRGPRIGRRAGERGYVVTGRHRHTWPFRTEPRTQPPPRGAQGRRRGALRAPAGRCSGPARPSSLLRNDAGGGPRRARRGRACRRARGPGGR